MTDGIWYLHPTLDRCTEGRTDTAWQAERLADPATRIIPVWGDRTLITGPKPAPRAVMASAAEDWWTTHTGAPILLGAADGVVHFAVDMGEPQDADLSGVRVDAPKLVDLRNMGWLLPADEAALLAQARALVWFHRRNRFCGVCGQPTQPVDGGTSRRCSDPACGVTVFPRVDPAVIVLVTDGDRALLGRQPVWPAGMHSVLAGFAEPGESLESCVRREVAEEAGVTVGTVTYAGSQPWPFPQSLMLGYRATARTTAITRHDQELEDAGWYTRAFLRSIRHNARGEGAFSLPPPHSIARWLINRWLDEDG